MPAMRQGGQPRYPPAPALGAISRSSNLSSNCLADLFRRWHDTLAVSRECPVKFETRTRLPLARGPMRSADGYHGEIMASSGAGEKPPGKPSG